MSQESIIATVVSGILCGIGIWYRRRQARKKKRREASAARRDEADEG